MVQVEEIIAKFQDREGNYKSIAEKLYPIYDWRRVLTEGIEAILNPVLSSLFNSKVLLDNSAFSATERNNVILLEGILQDLIDLDYKTKAGKTIEARTEYQKKELKKLIVN